MQPPKLKIEDGGSKIEYRIIECKTTLDPRSSILDPRSSIFDLRSSIFDLRSSILFPIRGVAVILTPSRTH
ncbi:MAG TPA: hypothetical protein VJZ77_14690 [Blastocatellia bacterium]|nr:hypothetical protein [Blastocatellia bacterium]